MLNKKGLTLVEVMIALVVLLIVSLALMQTALVSINSNMTNILRDEAVNIAEMRMNEARNMPFNSLVGTVNTPVMRNFRNAAIQYTVTRTVTNLNTDNKQVNITVTWDWKENTVANGNPLTHSITSIVRRL